MASSQPRGRKKTPWRSDPEITARLPDVERLHLNGKSNRAIAAQLGVTEMTIRRDLERIRALWLERAGDKIEHLKAQAAARLEGIYRKGLEQAEFDQAVEKAVIFDTEFEDEDGSSYEVQRPEKGGVTFKGQKAQALNVARQALMDQAKILGLVVDKVAPTDAEGNSIPITVIEAVQPAERPADPS